MAVEELAVGADRFEVVIVHFGEGLFGRRGVVGGVLGGHGEVRNWGPLYLLDQMRPSLRSAALPVQAAWVSSALW